MPWHDGLLVALGAIPGAWLRLRLMPPLARRLPRRHWPTFTVNVGAAFALGLLTARGQGGGLADRDWLLLLATGFLASLSTFSTLMVELLQVVRQGQPGEAALLAAVSVLAGVLAVQLGLVLGAA